MNTIRKNSKKTIKRENEKKQNILEKNYKIRTKRLKSKLEERREQKT